MTTIIYDMLFFICSLYIFLKVVGYAIYEIKEMNNKFGGIIIISFSIIVVLFANIMLWIH